jgi:hypothetical protein
MQWTIKPRSCASPLGHGGAKAEHPPRSFPEAMRSTQCLEEGREGSDHRLGRSAYLYDILSVKHRRTILSITYILTGYKPIGKPRCIFCRTRSNPASSKICLNARSDLVQLESRSSNTVLGAFFSEHKFSFTTIKLVGSLSAAALRFKKVTKSSSFK